MKALRLPGGKRHHCLPDSEINIQCRNHSVCRILKSTSSAGTNLSAVFYPAYGVCGFKPDSGPNIKGSSLSQFCSLCSREESCIDLYTLCADYNDRGAKRLLTKIVLSGKMSKMTKLISEWPLAALSAFPDHSPAVCSSRSPEQPYGRRRNHCHCHSPVVYGSRTMSHSFG